MRVDGLEVHADAASTDTGPYCQPLDLPAPQWLLRFEDTEHGELTYDSEQEARGAFARCEARGWRCTLLSPTPRARPADSVEPPDLEALQNERNLLRDALVDLSAMYGSVWDLTDGGLIIMAGSIPRFEAASEKARHALDATKPDDAGDAACST